MFLCNPWQQHEDSSTEGPGAGFGRVSSACKLIQLSPVPGSSNSCTAAVVMRRALALLPRMGAAQQQSVAGPAALPLLQQAPSPLALHQQEGLRGAPCVCVCVCVRASACARVRTCPSHACMHPRSLETLARSTLGCLTHTTPPPPPAAFAAGPPSAGGGPVELTKPTTAGSGLSPLAKLSMAPSNKIS